MFITVLITARPGESSQHVHFLFNIHFNIILTLIPVCQKPFTLNSCTNQAASCVVWLKSHTYQTTRRHIPHYGCHQECIVV